MARVLLVIPLLPERSYPGKFMGPDYLAGALNKNGHDVDILDLDYWVAQNKDERTKSGVFISHYIKCLKNFKPDIVGITNLSIQNDIANYLAWSSKEVLPQALVIKGGVHETSGGWEFSLKLHHDYVDACVVGDGEETILRIAEAVDSGKWEKEKGEIPFLAYWDGNKPILNSDSNGYTIAEVDSNRFLPARINYYSEYNFSVLKHRKTAQMMTSRGCLRGCAFCSESFLHRKVHHRLLENIEIEMKTLRKNGYKVIYFDDSTFTENPERALDIGRLAKKHRFKWGCNTRIDRLGNNGSLIGNLSDLGCIYLFCGVESFVPEILLAMKKTKHPTDYINNVEHVYKTLNEHSISSNIFLIFGNARLNNDGTIAKEKWQDVQDTIEQAVAIETEYISMNILRLLPGVDYSTESKYSTIRPVRDNRIHAGHYDLKWYMVNGKKDLRTNHKIFRCFEGAGSVKSNFITDRYAYEILNLAVKKVNEKNKVQRLEIIADSSTRDFLVKRYTMGRIHYSLSSFSKIGHIKQLPIIIEWKRILSNI